MDQRWFDLVPGFLTDFAIVRGPQYNVAYWNLHSRTLGQEGERYRVDGVPLAFFHFSGFDPEQPLSLSRFQDRIEVAGNPVLESLVRDYAHEVMQAGHAHSRHWPYSYRALGDGTEIDDLVRALGGDFEDEQRERNGVVPSLFTLAGAQAFRAWLSEEAPGAPAGVNRVLARLYESREDLRRAFPDLRGEDAERLRRWAREVGPGQVPLLAKIPLSSNDADSGQPSRTGHRFVMGEMGPLPSGPWGVNVVGQFHYPGDLGELARRFVSTLDQAGVPAAPIQDWSLPTAAGAQPYAVLPPDAAPYLINLICTAPDALGDFASQAGEKFFAGRYSIGFWSVDVAPPPGALSLVQEIWVPSRYVANVLAPDATVPIHVVPIPVEPGPVSPDRRRLGLPDDRFLFLASFARAEEARRIDPQAAIDAFTRAFGGEEAVELVINCLDGEDAALREAAAEQPAVRLVHESRSRQAVTGLISACDAYVSLHRSQPLGLSMAEAMWHGKPVVATAHGGNLEYMDPQSSFLVEAGPDLDHAAKLMRQVFENPAVARAVGARAAADIRRTHSSAVAGEAITQRLELIRATGRGPVARRSADFRALKEAQAMVMRGPPPGPRGGRGYRARGIIRKAVLRMLGPYTDYQQKVNARLLDAIEEMKGDVSTEQAARDAQLLAELRGARQLRDALGNQARGVEELRRIITLAGDRALYLALGELARRHASIDGLPGGGPSDQSLSTYELRGYSQNGEDGVLAEILRRIGVQNQYFVEFGVEAGREGNCVYLADVADWRGLFMEADEQLYRLLERKYAARPDIQTLRALVTPENVDSLLEQQNVPEDPDVLSIDVDGQDYWIWEAVERHRPRVVVIEYNSALDPRRRLVQPRDAGPWDGTEYFGASLGAVQSLGERKDYRLVHTELAGNNAFLVASELAEGRFLPSDQIAVRGTPNYFQAGYRHPPDQYGRSYLDLDTGELAPATR